MTEGRRTALFLARLGLTDGGAADTLARLGWWCDGPLPQDAQSVLWALSRAPDPNLALRALVRLAVALDSCAVRGATGRGWAELDWVLRRDSGARGRLFGVLGASTALGDHLVAHPEHWRG
ncbi:MAG: bifunctional [glutamine synthetase] adenylyltransferase/[glutamine synthetase]-adenylyl-L-tyrosine phosphorylase, partial [Pseudonocardiaceae bacterium]